MKMHRGNAFAKLGVQNALEAYHRLEGLGLFEKKDPVQDSLFEVAEI